MAVLLTRFGASEAIGTTRHRNARQRIGDGDVGERDIAGVAHEEGVRHRVAHIDDVVGTCIRPCLA